MTKKKAAGRPGQKPSQKPAKKGAPAKPARPAAKARAAVAKLKPKQRKYVEGRAGGKTKKQAALDAGYAPSTAGVAKAKIESSPEVREAFRVLAQQMIRPERVVARIVEGLDAEVTKFATFEGAITDQRRCVDFKERREYAKLAAEMAGYYSPKIELEHEGVMTFSIVNEVFRE